MQDSTVRFTCTIRLVSFFPLFPLADVYVQAADMEQMFRDRTQASTASQRGGERQGGQNGMLATTLSDLLEERKGAMTVFELESLATRYKTDVHTIERVCRHFNTPSVDERTAVRKRDERGDEVVVVAVRRCWRWNVAGLAEHNDFLCRLVGWIHR